jgi:2-succinyl-6-hydroxy-2,4-cyclohexadiene-1-carboxylate synthase
VQLIAPALSGHHGAPLRSESFLGEVTRLAKLIDEEAAAPPVVVGYSLGARLALGLALQHPHAVRALLLISVNPGLRSADERAARLAADEQLASFLELHGTRAFIEQHWEKQALFASQRALPDSVRALQTAQRLQHPATGLAHCLRTLGLGAMPSFWPALPTVSSRVPTTLVTGTLDQKFHTLANEICARSPKIAWLSAPDVGHNLLLEAPELLARLVDQAISASPA